MRRSNEVILIFGEDDNDREILRHLIAALCPQTSDLLQKRRKPLLLAKGAPPARLGTRATKLAAAVRAEAAMRPVRAVFVHEDADALPPADEHRETAMREAARAAGLNITPVVPAWEMEAWLALFPDAIAVAFPNWKRLKHGAQTRVDLVANAKQALRDVTTDKRSRRRYEERDGPKIAAKVRELGLAEKPVGMAKAYDRFRTAVLAQFPDMR